MNNTRPIIAEQNNKPLEAEQVTLGEQNLNGVKGRWIRRSEFKKVEPRKPKRKHVSKYKKLASDLSTLEPGYYGLFEYETAKEAGRDRSLVGNAVDYLDWAEGDETLLCYRTNTYYNKVLDVFMLRIERLAEPKKRSRKNV